MKYKKFQLIWKDINPNHFHVQPFYLSIFMIIKTNWLSLCNRKSYIHNVSYLRLYKFAIYNEKIATALSSIYSIFTVVHF